MKDLLKTKSFWTGIAAIATGIGLALGGDVADGLQTILGGVALITGRHAFQKAIKGDPGS